MVPETAREDMFILRKGKSPIIVVLDSVISTPNGSNTFLIIVRRNDSDCMEIDGQFDCRRWRTGFALLEGRIPGSAHAC